MNSDWPDRIRRVAQRTHSTICCGLDPDLTKLPSIYQHSLDKEDALGGFLREVIDLTLDFVSAYKLQKAFFDVYDYGNHLIGDTIAFIHAKAPEVPIILDSKAGDIDNTMSMYLRHFFDDLKADAVVLNPYMGSDVWSGLCTYPDKGAFVLVRTSNPGSAIVQELQLADGRALWQRILDIVAEQYCRGKNLFPILSSNSPITEDLVITLDSIHIPLFVAGIGAQGGKLDNIAALSESHIPILVNSSRALLYPYQPDEAEWRTAIRDSVITLRSNLNEALHRD
jgi:orotidine-5'-phosphate decarboxylase